MEVSGLVSRQIPHFPCAGTTDFSRPSKPSLCFSGELNFPASFEFGAKASLRINTRKKGRGVDLNCGFSDNGHVEYYYSGPRCDDDDKKMKKKKEKEIKKKRKLLRGLEGLGGAQVQTKLISEGAEALLQQLEKVRAEEKEMKRKKKKEEENAKRMKMKDCESSSSSSSSESESSGSECGEVIDMSSMRGGGVATQKILEGSEAVALLTRTSSETAVGISTSCGSIESIGHENASTTSSVVEEASSVVTKIEVCMGKKCKASGGVELMEEFERLMGVEGSVVGCKCLGKCKNGPNVRVLNSVGGIKPEEGIEDSVRNPTNPLYIGVGLEDVSLIVVNLMEEEVRKDFGI